LQRGDAINRKRPQNLPFAEGRFSGDIVQREGKDTWSYNFLGKAWWDENENRVPTPNQILNGIIAESKI
jgi:hypothetical protein